MNRVCVKFDSVFEISCEKTDRQTNAVEDLTPRLPSATVTTLTFSEHMRWLNGRALLLSSKDEWTDKHQESDIIVTSHSTHHQ